MIKVMFADGSLGMVNATRFSKLMRLGNVVAYQPFDVWIELRRKGNTDYFGPERRKSSLPTLKY